jgi:hypothetical protein
MLIARMRVRPLALVVSLPVLLVALLAPADAGAAKGKRPIVSPRPGQVVHSATALVRVRPGARGVRLNGKRIGGQLGDERRGVRALRASVSHGLKRGRNVLKVRRGKRTTTVRFAVRTEGPLVGAGVDRQVAVGGPVDLKGLVRGAGRGDRVRWRIVDRPRAFRRAARTPASLRSPAGRSARFRAGAPGHYTFQLSAGGEADRVVLSATRRQLLVPINTMPAADTIGIEVGGQMYPVSSGGDGSVQFQVLVFNRETLEFVSNDTYDFEDDPAQLASRLAAMDDSNLVIVSDQGILSGTHVFAAALAEIGVPKLDPGASGERSFSAVGVPGMKPGDAEYRLDPANQAGNYAGRMSGWLTPDQHGNYNFARADRVEFAAGYQQADPCGAGQSKPDCERNVGFRLNVNDAHTREVRPGDNQVYNTGGPGLTPSQQADEVLRLVNDLGSVRPGDTIALQTVGRPGGPGNAYAPPIGDVGRDAMAKLADAVANMGGTRRGIVSAATVSGSSASNGTVYALFGWAGAPEGAGAEAAAGIDGFGDRAYVSGVWQPGLDSQFRPKSVKQSTVDPTDTIGQIALQPPSTTWPLDGDKGASEALSYLGEQDLRLGPDPRSAYWIQDFTDISEWRDIAATIDDVEYPSDATFTKDDFDKAQKELVQELRWVYKVRSYLDEISTPYQDVNGIAWADAHTIADNVFKALSVPKESTALFGAGQMFSSFLKMLGPFTDGATTVAAGILDLSMQIFGATQAGSPSENELTVAADDLGNQLERQAQDSLLAIDRMGDILVSDYAKLSVVAPKALCNPGPSCPRPFAFTKADRQHASVDFQRGIERTAYEKLVPLGYEVFKLTRRDDNGNVSVYAAPFPAIARYTCKGYTTWSNATYPDLVSTTFPVELDTGTGRLGYQTYVVAAQPGGTDHYGTYPPQSIVQRMFGPVSKTNDPNAAGLGISMPAYVLSQKASFWEGSQAEEDDHCGWPAPGS